ALASELATLGNAVASEAGGSRARTHAVGGTVATSIAAPVVVGAAGAPAGATGWRIGPALTPTVPESEARASSMLGNAGPAFGPGASPSDAGAGAVPAPSAMGNGRLITGYCLS